MSCQGSSDDDEKGPVTHGAKQNILKVDKATGQSNYCHHFIIWMKFRVKVGSQNFNFLGRSQLLPPGLCQSCCPIRSNPWLPVSHGVTLHFQRNMERKETLTSMWTRKYILCDLMCEWLEQVST